MATSNASKFILMTLLSSAPAYMMGSDVKEQRQRNALLKKLEEVDPAQGKALQQAMHGEEYERYRDTHGDEIKDKGRKGAAIGAGAGLAAGLPLNYGLEHKGELWLKLRNKFGDKSMLSSLIDTLKPDERFMGEASVHYGDNVPEQIKDIMPDWADKHTIDELPKVLEGLGAHPYFEGIPGFLGRMSTKTPFYITTAGLGGIGVGAGYLANRYKYTSDQKKKRGFQIPSNKEIFKQIQEAEKTNSPVINIG